MGMYEETYEGAHDTDRFLDDILRLMESKKGYDADFAQVHKRHGLQEVLTARPDITHYVDGNGTIAAVKRLKKNGSTVIRETGQVGGLYGVYRYDAEGRRHGPNVELLTFSDGEKSSEDYIAVHYWEGKEIPESTYLARRAMQLFRQASDFILGSGAVADRTPQPAEHNRL